MSDSRPRGRFGTVLSHAALALAWLVVAGVSALSTMSVVLSSQEVKVPDLLGRRIAEAGSLAAAHRLGVRVEGRRYDSRVPEGRVAAQEPESGATLKASRSVRLWLSLGPKRVSVPSVTGVTLRAARLSMEEAGAPVARVLEAFGEAEEGVVMLQSPSPGPSEDVGGGASLLVSRGPRGRDYVMPDLIGRPGELAIEELRKLGLGVTAVAGKPYPGAARGVILKQIPPSGHRVGPRVPVTLELSGDPAR